MKPIMIIEAGMFKPPADAPKEAEAPEDQQADHGEQDYHEGEEEDLEPEASPDVDDEEEYQPEERHEETTPAPLKYDENTQKLVDQADVARGEFAMAEQSVRNIQNELNQIEEFLNKDFGIEEEFAPLEGQCFEYTDYEYIYRLCPFDKASQTAKSGAGETRLGVWSRWDGSESNKYSKMVYDKGQSCWNGPQRSAHVHVTCGSENKLVSVAEPNRCEYVFEFSTPAACRGVSDEQSDDMHDEL